MPPQRPLWYKCGYADAPNPPDSTPADPAGLMHEQTFNEALAVAIRLPAAPQTVRHSEPSRAHLQNDDRSPLPGLPGAGPA